MQEFVALPRVLFYLSLFLSLKSSLLSYKGLFMSRSKTKMQRMKSGEILFCELAKD